MPTTNRRDKLAQHKAVLSTEVVIGMGIYIDESSMWEQNVSQKCTLLLAYLAMSDTKKAIHKLRNSKGVHLGIDCLFHATENKVFLRQVKNFCLFYKP